MVARKKAKPFDMQKFYADMGFNPEEAPEIQEPFAKDKPLNVSLHAEAVLRHLRYPETPKLSKVCTECHTVFLTPYFSVAYCSDLCRREALKKHFGMEWWVEKTARENNEIEDWGGRVPPAIITEKPLAVMKYLVTLAEEALDRPIEPWKPGQQKFSALSYSDVSVPVVSDDSLPTAPIELEEESNSQPDNLSFDLGFLDDLV